MTMRTPKVRLAHASIKTITVALLLLLIPIANEQWSVNAQTESSARPRYFNIEGQVTLPDGRPAGNVSVKIRGTLGVNLETTANDAGRYEFHDVPSGNYQLEARSIQNPSLASDIIQANTFSTATNSVQINLSLYNKQPASRIKPGVISAVDAGQKVPRDARNAFEEGLKFRSETKPDLALASFSRAIELYPDYYQALAARGDSNLAKLQIAQAAADFDRALKSNPNYAVALRGAGYCKLVKGELPLAVQLFQKGVAADPDNARTYMLLGMAHFEMNARDDAVKNLLRALEIDAVQSARARLYLANIYSYQQQYLRAANEIAAYLKVVPTDADAAKLREMEVEWRAKGKR
jgi:predicted Zn-dependent protease